MTEAGVNSTASLRRLVPRIFSKAQPTGAVDTLMRTVRMHHPKADLALIERAYTVAERAHEGQKRKSGEPYITHPVAVAQILADLGIGSKTVAAALLHDTVEDTAYTLDQVRADFGDEIAMLVDGVTKLDKVKYGDTTQAETVRKMIVAMSKDIRVLIIKLADRLHNARTWGFVPGGVGDAQGDRDARDLRAARASPRHPDHQVGARGPLVRGALPEALRRDREPREAAHAAARGVRAAGHRPRQRRPQGREDPRQGRRPPEAVLLDLPEDDRARPRLRRDLRPRRHPGARELGARLLRRARLDPRPLDAAARPLQGLHRDPEVQPVPVAAHDGASARRAARSRSRSARTTCTSAPSSASPRTGSTRSGRPVAGGRPPRVRRTRPTWPGSRTSPTGRPRPPTRGSSSTRCASRSAPRRSTSSRRRAGSSACRRARRRSTSPTRCTPRSATARWARRSTAGSCRSRASCPAATWSRCSPRRTPTPGRARTGSTSSRARARATRSGSGSPRSAATRRSSRAATRSPARCASRTCRCRS